jgi:hypothetical protein
MDLKLGSLRKEDIRRLEAVEMWMWRRMERVSWMDKITNEEILNKVGEKRQLISVIRNRQKNWIGHVLRGEGLLREVMEGRMEGKRVRGRPRKGMLDELLVELSYGNMKKEGRKQR